MPPKQRQIRIEQRGAMAALEALEHRSDEELEAETKFKAAALSILGARAAERASHGYPLYKHHDATSSSMGQQKVTNA